MRSIGYRAFRGSRSCPADSGGISVFSFNVEGVHPHDVGTVLDRHNVAVRVGHHCAQPLMEKLGLAGTVRASLGVYNDETDIDRLAEAVEACREMFAMSDDLRELYQDIILDHGRHPRNFHALRAPDASGARPQPAVRRPGHGLSRGRRRQDRRCQLRGARLRDLDRLVVADDRGAEGQDDRRGAPPVRAIPRQGDRRRRRAICPRSCRTISTGSNR